MRQLHSARASICLRKLVSLENPQNIIKAWAETSTLYIPEARHARAMYMYMADELLEKEGLNETPISAV